MIVRGLALIVALTVGLGGIGRAAAAEPPIEIAAILELTGQVAFLGKSEGDALRMVEEITNRNGGVRGRPIHFSIADDQSNPQVSVQLANALIAKKVPVILGPGFSSTCNAVLPLVKNGPVVYCTSAAITPPPGSYFFGSTVGTSLTYATGIRYLRERGLTRLALLATVDATGQSIEASIDAALGSPANRAVRLVAREHFAPADLNVAAQISHIRSSDAQAILITASGTPFGTIVHGLSDAGVALPIFSPSSNMTKLAMTQYADYLPPAIYFASLVGQIEGTIGKGPIRDAQTVFFNALRAHNTESDSGYNTIWDVAMLTVDAYRHLGPAMTADQLHEYIENLHGWAGINGIYDYRDGGQRGLYESSTVVYTWNRARDRFVAASKTGGRL